MEDAYISLKEFCERTSISPSTAYRMIQEGRLPAEKLAGGRRYKIPVDFLKCLRPTHRHY